MTRSASILLPLLTSLLAVDAFFILTQPSLVTTRLDPIVNPGKVSGHVHAVVGGSNFDKEMTFDSATRSKCTTAPVNIDFSNYWVPQLYYYNPADQSYQAIPVGYVNTYYLPRAAKNETIHSFPDGLRMISGDPFRRSYSGSAADQAISFVCQDYYNDHRGDPEWYQRNDMQFKHNCPNGLRLQVNFPSCWDGKNLDSPDHKSHMAFASGGPEGGGFCSSSHPIHLVTLFYEFVYNVQDFPFNNAGSNPTWVLANGDTTGYGYHGDFVNGWTKPGGVDILQQAIDQCNDNNGVGGNLKDCPPFVPFLDYDGAKACKPENNQVNEDVGMGHPIKRLPGDNPMWTGNGTKPSTPGYVEPETSYTDFKSAIPAGFELVGCIAESKDGRALRAASMTAQNMTRGVCVSWCKDRGYPLAGIEYGSECYCDFQMRGSASNTTLLDEKQCGSTCSGNPSETCGGSRTLTLFNNPGLYPSTTLPKGWKAEGCRTEPAGARALKGYSFSANDLTPESCMAECQKRGFLLAGTEYSRECYCANSFANGSVAAPASECSMLCGGNDKQYCGGPSRLTTFSYSNATEPALLGCYADGYPRTLNGTSYSDATGMTPTGCIQFCGSKGWAFAGLESNSVDQGSLPQECRCGSALSQSLSLDASRCATPCRGASGSICGGDLALSVWSTGNGTAVSTGAQPTKRHSARRFGH